jgi:predicted RNA-binding protein with PIN domain
VPRGEHVPDDRRVLEGVARLIVDGTNVLHAIRRSATPLPAAALIGRLRAIVPAGVAITVVLDGSPEHGLVARHIAAGVEVRYSGRFTADQLIVRLLETYVPENSNTLIVTDDFELSNIVRRSGARTARTAWLVGRLERQRLVAPAPGRPGLVPPAAPSIGQGSARSGDGSGSGSNQGGDAVDPEAAYPPRWSPGRNATRKRGPSHRKPAGER